MINFLLFNFNKMIKKCTINNKQTFNIDYKNTKKTITIEFLDSDVKYESFFEKGDKIKCRKDNKCKHCIRNWEDGTYTIYPNRSGIPYYIH